MSAAAAARFLLLLLLLLASSVSMMSEMLSSTPIPGIHEHQENSSGCVLAAGGDPLTGTLAGWLQPVLRSNSAYDACSARYGWQPPWWPPFAGSALMVVAAGALYWGLPAWKGRRHRVVPVEEIDTCGDLPRLLGELAASAGLVRAPRFVVDPAARTTGAVVFGRPRRYTICLHGGLVARRSGDADGFRAVVLHEIAHIRNRDVGLTYATVALWRVYLLAPLLPYAALAAVGLFSLVAGSWPQSPFGPIARTVYLQELLLSAVMVALVYLVRADILRSREINADIAAVGWGADPRVWRRGGWDPGRGIAVRNAVILRRSLAYPSRVEPAPGRRDRSVAAACHDRSAAVACHAAADVPDRRLGRARRRGVVRLPQLVLLGVVDRPGGCAAHRRARGRRRRHRVVAGGQ